MNLSDRVHMTQLTDFASYAKLQQHYQQIADTPILDWFNRDAERFKHFSLKNQGILLDYSKNRINSETLKLLCALADDAELKQKISALFKGDAVNFTEQRPALHMALRDRKRQHFVVNGKDIMEEIRNNLDRMRAFTTQFRNHQWLGATGKPIRDIVNIGIGGSHLGPMMTIHALADTSDTQHHCHFISNVDSAHIQDVLQQLDPATTLFIVSSKSFTTLETLTNAQTVLQWQRDQLATQHVQQHWFAVTAAKSQAMNFGIPEQQIFPMWDWVGGRYSIWSAIGLPLALMIGMEGFIAFLDGAHAMDEHFQQTDFLHNMPVILALLGIWYSEFFHASNYAIIPYSHRLNYFHHYIQQADMESNGKSITREGNAVTYQTGPIIWGDQGCNGQHSFYQSLHQGKHLVPVDFIMTGKPNDKTDLHHDILIASGLSQAQALMLGKSQQSAYQELIAAGYNEQEAKRLATHKAIPGNRPSNVIFLESLTPSTLGALIALYEHKIFVQSCLWNINAFDQWGVELGKQLLPNILSSLQNKDATIAHDASTAGLANYYKNLRKTS